MQRLAFHVGVTAATFLRVISFQGVILTCPFCSLVIQLIALLDK
jgi:hypothetical protein